jgi:competence protein ComEC
VLGRIRTTEPPHAPTLWLRYATVIDGMREAIDKRIRAVLPGDKGSIASALITSKRDALSAPVFDAMYISGIGHMGFKPLLGEQVVVCHRSSAFAVT